MGHFAKKCYIDKKNKGKDEKINVTQEIEEELALMIVFSSEYGELLL